MKILVVNPNTTASMTAKIAAAARAVAQPETEIVAVNPAEGPASIQGYLDAALCVPGILEVVSKQAAFDAIVVGCFDDTGVDALRCVVDTPVIGIGEAAYHAASMIAPRFSVVTTLSRSVAGLEANLLRYGFDRKCGKVRASDVPVLSLETGDEECIARIREQIGLSIDEDGAEAIVLGCAGMTDLMTRLSQEFGLPVIDGVTCAVTMAEALVSCGLRTSKKRTYSVA